MKKKNKKMSIKLQKQRDADRQRDNEINRQTDDNMHEKCLFLVDI